ncbi:hypothetical protein FRX31_003673 [Thalictrum thalictroides]|uniref:Uncharacterized protein n=1 Tax=Thalictrum thalictroides TaxID=46969 RepID=A0A7J6XAU3_THATH|nr:hypothetical protein FRX31_003673 [Thalictrum thalictroides]
MLHAALRLKLCHWRVHQSERNTNEIPYRHIVFYSAGLRSIILVSSNRPQTTLLYEHSKNESERNTSPNLGTLVFIISRSSTKGLVPTVLIRGCTLTPPLFLKLLPGRLRGLTGELY